VLQEDDLFSSFFCWWDRRLESKRNGGDVEAGAARLQQPLLLLPLAAGALPAACQAVQEDHLGDLPAATGMSNSALLSEFSRF
jgi:hypothetical protein